MSRTKKSKPSSSRPHEEILAARAATAQYKINHKAKKASRAGAKNAQKQTNEGSSGQKLSLPLEQTSEYKIARAAAAEAQKENNEARRNKKLAQRKKAEQQSAESVTASKPFDKAAQPAGEVSHGLPTAAKLATPTQQPKRHREEVTSDGEDNGKAETVDAADKKQRRKRKKKAHKKRDHKAEVTQAGAEIAADESGMTKDANIPAEEAAGPPSEPDYASDKDDTTTVAQSKKLPSSEPEDQDFRKERSMAPEPFQGLDSDIEGPDDASTRSADHDSVASYGSIESKPKHHQTAGKTARGVAGTNDETSQEAEPKPFPSTPQHEDVEMTGIIAPTTTFSKMKASRAARREASKSAHKPTEITASSVPTTPAPVLESTEAPNEKSTLSEPVKLPSEDCPIPGVSYTAQKWISEKEWQSVLKKRQKKVQEMSD